MEQGLAPPGANAAILGDGKLGLLIAEVLARRVTDAAACDAGSRRKMSGDPETGGQRGTTTIIGRHKEKMDMCCSGLRSSEVGAEGGQGEIAGERELIRVDAGDKSAVAALSGSFDVVVDATGSPQGFASASELCRPMG